VFVVGGEGLGWWRVGAADRAAGTEVGFSAAAAGGGCRGVTVGGRR